MFPSTGSIPPPCFYTPQGLAGWLNLNPIPWKDYFSYTGFFDNLIPTSLRQAVFQVLVIIHILFLFVLMYNYYHRGKGVNIVIN